ncbi:MAG: threonine--tRNA ligase [Rhodospirillaceae bacterium]
MNLQDHRSIGRKLGLFHQQDEGPGMVFWHPRGFALYHLIEDYIRVRMRKAGFSEIRTPQVLSRALWEKSGHWQKFAGNMFTFHQDGEDGSRDYALKPMSCPCHVQVFKAEQRSFRDLPLRFAEFGLCHRNEPSGALAGLMRTRAFTQDDAHIFCREEDVVPEVARFCALLRNVYADFGFNDVVVGFSTRPAVREGADDVWDRAEASLQAAAESAGLQYRLQPGEGAFYGPKLEFVLRDARGREWQCGTIQLDLVLPDKLDARYVDWHNDRLRPVMIHHAVLGSIERFIAILLEHYEGRLPLWLAPEQLAVASITAASAGYARRVHEAFAAAGFRPVVDVREERIGRKVADAREAAIPVFVAVGDKEAAHGTVSMRRRDGRHDVMPLEAAIDGLRGEAFK